MPAFCSSIAKARWATLPTPQVPAAGKVVLFDGPTQLFPGISTIPAHGHTPGHTLFAVESKGEKIVFSGDLVHAAAVQMPRPDATIQFDADEAAAAADRQALFTRFAAMGLRASAAPARPPAAARVRRGLLGRMKGPGVDERPAKHPPGTPSRSNHFEGGEPCLQGIMDARTVAKKRLAWSPAALRFRFLLRARR